MTSALGSSLSSGILATSALPGPSLIQQTTGKAELEADHPDWIVWRSDAGRWYTTRAGSLTDQQFEAGYAMTVTAEGPDDLRHALADQAHPGEGTG